MRLDRRHSLRREVVPGGVTDLPLSSTELLFHFSFPFHKWRHYRRFLESFTDALDLTCLSTGLLSNRAGFC